MLLVPHMLVTQVSTVRDGKELVDEMYRRVLLRESARFEILDEQLLSNAGSKEIPRASIKKIRIAKGMYLWVEGDTQKLIINPTGSWNWDPSKKQAVPVERTEAEKKYPIGFEVLGKDSMRVSPLGPAREAMFRGKPVYTLAVKTPDERVVKLQIDKQTLLPMGWTSERNGSISRVSYQNVSYGFIQPASLRWSPPGGIQRRSLLTENVQGRLLRVGSVAPTFELMDPDGKRIRLQDLLQRNRAVLLVFWFTNCAGCRTELPKLNAIARKNKGLGILGINVAESAYVVRGFWETMKMRFPTVIDPADLSSVVASYKSDAFPAFYLIGQGGKILYRGVGFDYTVLQRELLAAGFQP